MSRHRLSQKTPYRELWAVFSHPDHAAFFRRLAKRILAKYAHIEVTVLTALSRSMLSIPAEFILLDRADVCFLDAAFLLQEHPSSAGWLFRGSAPFLVLATSESELDRTREYAGTDQRLGVRLEGLLGPERCFLFDPEMAGPTFDALCENLDKAVSEAQRRRTFICHASEDSYFTGELAALLAANGVPVWYDEWSLRVGDSLVEKINEGIGDSRFMGVVLSKYSVDKPWCKKEMNSGLALQLAKSQLTILPILLDDCDVPPLFAELLWADFRGSRVRDGFDARLLECGVERLLDAIRAADNATRPRAPRASTVTS